MNKKGFLVLLLSLFFLLNNCCNEILAGTVIEICGSVHHIDIPNKQFANLRICIESIDPAEGTKSETIAEFSNNRYFKSFGKDCLKNKFEVKLYDDNYIQIKPIVINAKTLATYENTLWINHKKNYCETKLNDAENLLETGDVKKAEMYIDESLRICPLPKTYLIKVQIIDYMLKRDKLKNHTAVKFINNLKYDENFQKFSNDFKHNVYYEYGLVLSNKKYLNKHIDDVTTYYDLAVKSFDDAIAMEKDDSKAYQGKYSIQSLARNYYEMIYTIKSYFDNNKEIKNENTVKQFLSDWVYGIEKLTGYPERTETKYIRKINKYKNYRQAWDDIYDQLVKYENYFMNGEGTINKRLIVVKKFAEKIRSKKNEH